MGRACLRATHRRRARTSVVHAAGVRGLARIQSWPGSNETRPNAVVLAQARPQIVPLQRRTAPEMSPARSTRGFPVEQQGCFGMGDQLSCLSPFKIGVENESARVVPFEQYHPDRWLTVCADTGQGHCIGIVRLSRLGLHKPIVKAGEGRFCHDLDCGKALAGLFQAESGAAGPPLHPSRWWTALSGPVVGRPFLSVGR
jgi:hypothetical protein